MTAERHATFAGRFYPGDRAGCARMFAEMFGDAEAPAGCGAVVPHAGWIYSGAPAALGWAGIAAYAPEVVVIFGAEHLPDPHSASVFPRGGWRTPMGIAEIDERLAQPFVLGHAARPAPEMHAQEHSIEVQIPLMQHVLPGVKFVPVMVRPGPEAVEVGRRCAKIAQELGVRAAFVGSTDLTHYGPAFGFEPEGRGWVGIRWAKDVNDRRMIDLIAAGRAEEVVPEAAAHRNACGSGAVAALLGAMQVLGVDDYHELQHRHSAEVRAADDPAPLNSVGYESGIFVQS